MAETVGVIVDATGTVWLVIVEVEALGSGTGSAVLPEQMPASCRF